MIKSPFKDPLENLLPQDAPASQGLPVSNLERKISLRQGALGNQLLTSRGDRGVLLAGRSKCPTTTPSFSMSRRKCERHDKDEANLRTASCKAWMRLDRSKFEGKSSCAPKFGLEKKTDSFLVHSF